MSAKKSKAPVATAKVKAAPARKTAAKKAPAKKVAKTVVAAAKRKLSKAQGDAIAAKLKPASKARLDADAKRSVKKAVKTTLAMQTANAPFIKGVDDVAAQPEARIVKAVGKGKRVVPPKSAATDTSMDPALHASKPMPQLQEGKPDERTMPRSYIRSTGIGGGKLRGKTFQCTVSFTAEQMPQVRGLALFRNVSLAEAIRACVIEHANRHLAKSQETSS